MLGKVVRSILLSLLFVSGVFGFYALVDQPTPNVSAASLQILPPDIQTEALPTAFYWKWGGEQSTASIWFGPWMSDEAGSPTRFWSLVVTMPGTEHPLLLLQGRLEPKDNRSIRLRMASFELDVCPKAGMPWAHVAEASDLQAELTGFY